MTCDILQRIEQYLISGGLFNPELMNHDAVRQLLVECRDKLKSLDEEATWVRRKLGLSEDCGFVSGRPTLAGEMHVVCADAHGMRKYISSHKCDDKQGEIARLSASLAKIRAKIEDVVCTEGCDKGVVMLSRDGPTHYDEELKCQVYDHEYFSPLGDALIAIHDLTSIAGN